MSLSTGTERPYKHIEVVDSRTNQTCKVACLSCIKGHRTTNCGNAVCRQKVFWTVKRPGRPANVCSCAWGPSGRCRCVVTRPRCPHKPKKGERRTVDCRCDEAGRLCCLIEPHHWDVLMNSGSPIVDFYPSREALFARDHPAKQAATVPSSQNQPLTSGTVALVNGPLASPGLTQGPHYRGTLSADATLTPFHEASVLSLVNSTGEFGREPRNERSSQTWILSAGVPEQPAHHQLSSNGLQRSVGNTQAPPDIEESSQQSVAPGKENQSVNSTLPILPLQQYGKNSGRIVASSNAIDPGLNLAILPPQHVFDFDYFSYQLPSAICQSCGMSGCTCRSCPPTMQNAANGSWGQCCARKHVQNPSPLPSHRQSFGGCCNSVAECSSQVMPEQERPQTNFRPIPLHQVPMVSAECSSGGAEMVQPAQPSETPVFRGANGLFPEPGNGALSAASFGITDLDGFIGTGDELPVDFDEFLEEDLVCGCGDDCPCEQRSGQHAGRKEFTLD